MNVLKTAKIKAGLRTILYPLFAIHASFVIFVALLFFVSSNSTPIFFQFGVATYFLLMVFLFILYMWGSNNKKYVHDALSEIVEYENTRITLQMNTLEAMVNSSETARRDILLELAVMPRKLTVSFLIKRIGELRSQIDKATPREKLQKQEFYISCGNEVRALHEQLSAIYAGAGVELSNDAKELLKEVKKEALAMVDQVYSDACGKCQAEVAHSKEIVEQAATLLPQYE